METTVQQIDLQPFCSTDTDGRYGIDKPWVKDGWRHATDGRICIRLPATGEPDALPEKRVPHFDEVLPPVDGNWQPWPQVESCGSCFGRRHIDCDECGGDGTCDQCKCKGAHNCGCCEGTGKVTCKACHDPGGFDRFLFGETELARCYAYLVAKLPGPVEFLPTTKKDGKVRFRFSGGEGAVMGFRD